MKYLYADSSEFPLQEDFLALLDNFIETSVKTISVENTVFDLKEKVRDRRRIKNSVLDEMNNFLSTVDKSITESVEKSKEKEAITQYADKSRSFLKQFIEEGRIKFSDEIFHEISGFEEQINAADEENRKTLETFFINDPVPVISKKYTLNATKKGYSVKVLVDYEGDISIDYEINPFEQPFWDSHVKARDFIKDIDIPAKMKKPLLKKELEPEIINIEDYHLTDLVNSGTDLEVVFRKKFGITSERVRIKKGGTDDSELHVYYAEENAVEKDILAVPELENELNTNKIDELTEKIIAQVNTLYSTKQHLVSIKLKDNDVFEEDRLFDLMQEVAAIFAPTVEEINKHNASKEELSLKIEDDTGKRSEIYLRKSKIKEKLLPIKEKGDRLYEILAV